MPRKFRGRRARAGVGCLLCLAAMGGGGAAEAHAATLIRSDLEFMLQQIRVAEGHAAGGQLSGTGPNQISNVLFPYGMRTVTGEENNLVAGQKAFGAADTVFPRLLAPRFNAAEALTFDPDGDGRGAAIGDATSYEQKKGIVEDSRPRTISNLIVDQTANNPAAVAAADSTPGSRSTDHDDDPDTPELKFIPNQTPDEALSAPYNSWFTLFGQFFDHGLDLLTKGNSGTVFVPLKADDPLIVGADGEAGTADDPENPPPADQRFMVLTRASNLPGPDGVVGDNPRTPADESADDVKEHTNTTTSFVDQNQTYTSHPSHQVFLREYERNADGKTVATGKMLDLTAEDGGLANWAKVKEQARELLGIQLSDQDILNVPLLATDQYGKFIPGTNGYAKIVMPDGLVEGDPEADGGKGLPTTGARRTNHAFLDDIAHHAVPFGDHDGRPETPRQALAPDETPGTNDDGSLATYDDELLNAHFITGDGRGNENIGLTAVHHVFHSEHNRLVEHIKTVVLGTGDHEFLNHWLVTPVSAIPEDRSTLVWNGERLFQAARFATEMQYQHLVFEEFARKVQPQVNLFAGYETDIDPSITAEFAHTVYRFGHSMLNDTVDRVNADGTRSDIGLIEAFLNPLAFAPDGVKPKDAAGAIVRGMTRQRGNEIDEFVTEALRSNLLGLPLDLATINMTRARDTGVPSLNAARREFHKRTSHSALAPYDSWADFKRGLRHPESLVNFIAAYGTHDTVRDATTLKAKREAATALVLGGDNAPTDRLDFLYSQGEYANQNGVTTTGLDDVDFWIGGLAERQMPFGGLLGSTFNFVFETQMEKLQDGDRFYYLTRTAGLNFLTQLEESSFAELVMRNTGTKHLPFDVFSSPDYTFELSELGTEGPIDDDPATDYDESQLLERMPNGTVRFGGGEHIVMGGTDAADDMRADDGDDTLWGDDGGDRLEGGAGNDALNGNDGDDILTDVFGDDNIKGGDGDDAVNAGSGLDLILSGFGDDYVRAGADPKETFAGGGDDVVDGGDSSDTVFGNEGDDWIEGGGQADLLQGGNGDPFQDDTITGDDVIIGEGGNDDYDSEGGDDIMVTGPGIERNEGMLGFDWVTHKGDPQAANADMAFTGLLPPDEDNVRDRFDQVEGLSGWKHDDVLRGDDVLAADMVGHELANADQIAKVDGLGGVLGDGATSFTGGNIVLGGAGSDELEGRGGDDLIDGDAWLDVQLQAGSERVDDMGSLQADVFAGRLNPGDIDIVRAIRTAAAGTDVDRAVFSGLRAEYDVNVRADGTITVAHTRGTATDGTDTVRNVERLVFADETVVVAAVADLGPASRTFAARPVGSTSPAQTVTLANTGILPLRIGSVALAGGNAGDFAIARSTCGATVAAGAACAIDVTFSPTVGGARAAVLRVTESGGRVHEVALSGTGIVNRPATGGPQLSDATPRIGQTLTAITTSIADADGLGTFGYQWQQTPLLGDVTGPWTNVAGATGRTFTVPAAGLTRRYRVVVTFTDGGGSTETLTSVASARATLLPNTGTAPTPVPDPPAPLAAARAEEPVALSAPAAADTPAAPAAGGDAPAAPATPAPLRVADLTVAAPSASALTVQADVPAGARTVRITVFRLSGRPAASRVGRKRIATVYRTTSSAKRYTFRLGGRALRNLKPGRYLVEVRVGASRADLGPATTRTVTVKKRTR